MEAIVPWWGILPFVAMLLCIALLPLIPATSHHWENWKFQLAIALGLGIPTAIWVGLVLNWTRVGHAVFEYIQFIMLLFALFVVSGGLFLKGDIRATPKNNTVIMAIGAVAASFIGTTGAAMLLIRPILNINHERRHKVHTVVFTILIVANNGGMLTPLGDPPLFMGFLRGVPFTWTFSLLPMWAFINAMLLVIYFALDTKQYSREEVSDRLLDATHTEPIKIVGTPSFFWFAMVIAGTAFVPSMDLHAIETGHAAWHHYIPWREIVYLTAAAGSYLTGSRKIRFEYNQFSWGPIREVAVIFIGIFLTMIPALQFLSQVADKLPLNTVTFYGFSGTLSAFLDNAPTYVTFFTMAQTLGADPAVLTELGIGAGDLVAGVPPIWLAAISLGSVTCGAITYIGNGPNFMVKAVAESRGVEMPSFGGYIAWTVRYLVPTLVAMVCIFLTESMIAMIVGLLITAALVGQSALLWLRYRAAAKAVYNQVGSRARGEAVDM